MKVALIYTSTTKELTTLVEKEVKENLGNEVEILSFENPEILVKVRAAGFVTAAASAELIALYVEAIRQGVDGILNICSSVGEVADIMQNVADFVGIPIVRIDEEMCAQAVRVGKRIAVLATLETTLEPTKKTIRKMARKLGKQVEIVDGLIEGAFGLNQQEFREVLITKAQELKSQTDVILLAQGSMAYVEKDILEAVGVVTLSSPRFGAIELRKALEKKGMIGE